MLRRHVFRACCVGLIALAGCGDDPAEPTTPADLTGTWNSSGTDANGNGFTLTLTLTQTGNAVTGTGQILNVTTGAINGTVSGNKLTFQFTFSPTACPGTLNGTATVSGNQLNGSFGGTTQCMGTVQASFQGLRRP